MSPDKFIFDQSVESGLRCNCDEPMFGPVSVIVDICYHDGKVTVVPEEGKCSSSGEPKKAEALRYDCPSCYQAVVKVLEAESYGLEGSWALYHPSVDSREVDEDSVAAAINALQEIIVP